MEIITIANYREQYPADQYQDNLITTAINMSFDILNYKYSGNVIAERWEKTEETGGFTEAQKEHIKRAFLIQSRYYLQTGLRQATGSIQRTSGSVGLNINVPNRDEVQQGAILALEAAGITSLMSSQGGKVRAINECDEINLSKFATIDLVKAMCLQTQYTPSEGRDQKKNKIVKYNDDAIAEWVDLDYTLSNEYLKKSEAAVTYQTINDEALLTTDKTVVGAINELFNTAPSQINWDTAPTAEHGEGYAVTSEGIKNYVDTKETNLQSQITTNAENITLKQNATDNNLQTISKSVVGAINEINARPSIQLTRQYNSSVPVESTSTIGDLNVGQATIDFQNPTIQTYNLSINAWPYSSTTTIINCKYVSKTETSFNIEIVWVGNTTETFSIETNWINTLREV